MFTIYILIKPLFLPIFLTCILFIHQLLNLSAFYVLQKTSHLVLYEYSNSKQSQRRWIHTSRGLNLEKVKGCCIFQKSAYLGVTVMSSCFYTCTCADSHNNRHGIFLTRVICRFRWLFQFSHSIHQKFEPFQECKVLKKKPLFVDFFIIIFCLLLSYQFE